MGAIQGPHQDHSHLVVLTTIDEVGSKYRKKQTEQVLEATL